MLAASLLLPFFSIYVSSSVPGEWTHLFPEQLTGFDLLLHSASLPAAQMPALNAISFRAEILWLGLCLTALGIALFALRKRVVSHIAPVVGALGALVLIEYAFYTQLLSSALLTSVMLTAKWAVWLAPVLAAGLAVVELAAARSLAPLGLKENTWRIASAALAILAAAMIFLPFTQTRVPDGLFASADEDSALRVTQSGYQLLTGQESLISSYLSDGYFTSPTTSGLMGDLAAITGNSKPIANLFKITTFRPVSYTGLSLGLVLLLAAGLIQLFKGIDKWVPACLSAIGAVLCLAGCASMLVLSQNAQFAGITQQMMSLGMGSFTIAPMLLTVLAALAAGAAILRIKVSNVPYFVNPVPKNKQLRMVSLLMAVLTCMLLMLPLYSAGIYAPGKPQSPALEESLHGYQLIAMQRSDSLTDPRDRKGASYYTDDAPAVNGYTASNVKSIFSARLTLLGVLALLAVLAMAAYLALLITGKTHKRVLVLLALLSAILILFGGMLCGTLLPKDLGRMTAQAPLYFALAAAVFAAFFAGFSDHAELPKKYKLFLMMLPFLGFSLVFSYLPLAGWRYAFYDYRLGLPDEQQAYVGFKWFTQMFMNPAQRAEVLRVLRNTFGMSGIGLATSWMPVVFAILLTEIKTGWFKKFAQIFTTLPNFISWVLVFSFALVIFSAEGAVNQIMVGLGLLKEPVIWLNSGEHIWLKMWLWSTWKGLGWGSIMYLAAIAGIDQELYEAARVDGAGRFRQIWHITVPGILPTFFVLLLLSISNIINNGMEQYLVFQNPINKSTIEVLDLYVYNISLGARSSTTISMATAIGILKSIVSVVLLFLANSFSKAVRGESIV